MLEEEGTKRSVLDRMNEISVSNFLDGVAFPSIVVEHEHIT
jgi:hypothetical protein